LAAYYPSVGGRRAPDAELAAALQQLVVAQREAIEWRLLHGATQTNEVARCAGLWPALAATAALTGRPDIALLDFGSSAGLNLGVDAYAYRYRLPSGASFSTGLPPDGERVEIEADWLGGAWPEAGWRLVERLGLDPQPVQLDDPDQLRWLRACLWPQDARRDERLRRAARAMRWPVRAEADCIAAIEPWLEGLPTGVQPLLFNSWVLTYLPAAELQRLRAAVDRLARSHGLAWLSAELARLSARDQSIPPLPALTAAQLHGSPTLWTLRWPQADAIKERALLWSHPHGQWVAGLD
jgi:hypothetical protein